MSNVDPLWPPPPSVLSLSHDAVHVWRAMLDVPLPLVAALWPLLSADEVDRANRLYFPQDRHRFIVARGLLRTMLGGYLQTRPELLRFGYSAFGKPFLEPATGQEPLSFNISHDGELALYGFTRGRSIGIDLARIDPTIEYEQIAARFFSPIEYARLCGLLKEHRATAFFTCWTRKEAYLKAHGAGLSLPLDRFVVSLAPDEPAQLLQTLDDPAEAARWTLHELVPGPGYQAALVVAGQGWQLARWQWQQQDFS